MSKNDKKIFYKTLVMSNDINTGGRVKDGGKIYLREWQGWGCLKVCRICLTKRF
jgi:hypothetical protein